MLWLYRLIYTPFPLAEVMTLAWHSHYATSQAKVNSAELMLAQHNAQRALWRAPISQLHRRMLGDGAMRRWLDGLNSTKAQPNENLGREFLELFSLGEGQLHRARRARGGTGAHWLAGGRFSRAPRRVRYAAISTTVPRQSWARQATGVWTIWSKSRATSKSPQPTLLAGCTTHSFPTPICLRPVCSRPGLRDANSGRCRRRPGNRSRIAIAALSCAECRGRFVKSPVGLAIGAIRSLELFAPPPDLVDLEIHLTKMGQRLFFPPSVAGWPRGLDWLGGQELVARANFAAWVDELSRQGTESHLSGPGEAIWS